MSDTICTVSGHYFDFKNPHSCNIAIEDIAHGLSNICRFTGHTRRHYSVAQHSVMVSDILPPHLQLAGLLHDAAEAYIGDVSSPLKRMLPDYKLIEMRVEEAIFNRFNVLHEMRVHKAAIKQADLVLLATEKRDLMPLTGESWDMLGGVHPLERVITPWCPNHAKAVFLGRYKQLTS